MDGIMYVTDDENKKKFVQIDLEKYGDIWNTFYQMLSIQSKKQELFPVFTKEQLIEKVENSYKEIKNGQLHNAEDVHNEMEEWIK